MKTVRYLHVRAMANIAENDRLCIGHGARCGGVTFHGFWQIVALKGVRKIFQSDAERLWFRMRYHGAVQEYSGHLPDR